MTVQVDKSKAVKSEVELDLCVFVPAGPLDVFGADIFQSDREAIEHMTDE